MIKDVKPYTGPIILDLKAIAGILIDLVNGTRQRLRSEKEGLDEVLIELKDSYPAYGAAAGIPAVVYDRIVKATGDLKEIREMLPVARKIVEVLEESESYYASQREDDIGLVADSIKSNARRLDPALLAPFQRTLAYYSQWADKAVKTRVKNAKASKAEKEAEKEAEEKVAKPAEEKAAKPAEKKAAKPSEDASPASQAQ